MSVLAPLAALIVACIGFGALLASYVAVQLVWPPSEFYPDWVRAALALMVFGLTGYVTFFVVLARVDTFFVIKTAYLIAVPAFLVSGAIKGYYGRLELRLTLGLVLLTLLYVALLFSLAPQGEPTSVAAARYSHGLPIDNVLPKILADMVLKGTIRVPMVGDWHASDRPPLQAGLYLLLRPMPGDFIYQVVGMCLQMLALPALAILLRAVGGLSARVFVLTVVAVAISPVFLVFTVFVWPKLLAAAFALVATAFVIGYFRSEVGWRLASIGIGLSAGLSFGAHGGTAFYLLGMGLAALLVLRTPLIVWAGAAMSFVAVYLPWFIFQKFIDPPGDRLLKWMLAGHIPPTEKGFREVLWDAYGSLTLDTWVDGRLANLSSISGGLIDHTKQLLYALFPLGERSSDIVGGIRAAEFFGLLPAQQLLLSIGIVAAIVNVARGVTWRREYVFLGTAVLLAIVAWVCLIFQPGATVNHQGSIATNLLLTALLAISIGCLDWRILAATVGVTACLNFRIYVLKGIDSVSINWLWVGVAAVCAILIGIALFRRKEPAIE